MAKKKKEKPLKVHATFEELLTVAAKGKADNSKDLFVKRCKELSRKIKADLKNNDREQQIDNNREFSSLVREYCDLTGKAREDFSKQLFVILSTNAKGEMLMWLDDFLPKPKKR
jgi:hypothetical protein